MKLSSFVYPTVASMFLACVMSSDPEPVEPVETAERAASTSTVGDEPTLVDEPDLVAEAVHCAGSTTYYKWQCDTMLGKWSYNVVGVKTLDCNARWRIDGQTTNCFQQDMQACGGGDDEDCQRENYCQRPSTPCLKYNDPPPCCLQ